MIMENPMRIVAGLAAVTVVLAACEKPSPSRPDPGPLPVTVVPAETRDIPDRRRYAGTTQAVEEVVLKARVEGFLEARHYEEGEMVSEGDVMFVIEQAPYEASLLRAQGTVREAEARLADARLVVERNRPLADSGAISTQDFDRQLADLAVAEGAYESAVGARIEAEIQLGYTEVRTPVTGRAGRRLVDVGNLVGGGGTASNLATVVTLDPIHVLFEPSGREAADFLAAWPSGKVPVTATVPGTGTTIQLHGTLDLVDNAAASSTSTFVARAVLDNPDGHVMSGLSVGVDVELGAVKGCVVVPEEAIQLDPQKAFVWVAHAGKLSRKTVELGTAWQGVRVVIGLDAGETVVVAGNPLGLKTGADVKPTRESIEDFLARKGRTGGHASDPLSAHPAQSPAAKSSVTDAAASSHTGKKP